jgi:muramidase (phage lysozyme)
MAFPYRLYGGASRPDAISQLDPAFSQALVKLYENAPPEVQRELALASAYRSHQRQQELFDASDRSGKKVAKPGTSKHEFGRAADLYGFGLKGGGNAVSQATKDYVMKNAGTYGLSFPMDYEPWHIQLAAATGTTPEQIKQAFLSSIAQGESPGYDVMYGGAKFTDFSKHPHQNQTVGGVTSDVAGRYQFKGSTWDEQQKKYGYKDFSQANQDLAAWNYASDIYKQKTGGSLEEALSSGDAGRINAVGQILNQTWSSLPGGKEQAKGYGTKTFNDVLSGYLGKAGDTSGAPAGTDTPVADDAGRADLTKLLAGKGDDKKHNWMTALGEGLSGMKGGSGVKFVGAPSGGPGEAPRTDAPAVSPLVGQDPNKRQYLAALMAQLNSGRLFA